MRIQSAGDFRGMMESTQRTLRAQATSPYATCVPTRRFMLALRDSLDTLPESEKRPLSLVDGPLPWFITPWGDIVRHSSELLAMFGQEVRIRPDGKYFVSEDGTVVLAASVGPK